jgi:hypothetical protein
MASITGLVHSLTIDPGATTACFRIGPAPAFVELMVVAVETSDPPHVAAFKTSMIDGLAQALASGREVSVDREDSGPRIFSLQMR